MSSSVYPAAIICFTLLKGRTALRKRGVIFSYPIGLIRHGRPITKIKRTAYSGRSEIPKQKARLTELSPSFRDYNPAAFDRSRETGGLRRGLGWGNLGNEQGR
jgi:hypothetical protein